MADFSRRAFVRGAAASVALPLLPFQQERSGLRITGVRLVRTRPKRPLPPYKPAAGAWGTPGTIVAKPLSIYPEYRANPARFQPDPTQVSNFTVEIATNKGVTGYGQGGLGGGPIVTGHFARILVDEDPFDIERLWDIMWRASLHYGRAGVAVHAISGVDLALWDLIGNALQVPVYKLLGGLTKPRIAVYCTGNDIEQHQEFGFRRLKLAIPYGPADGQEGMRKNLELVRRARQALGPDGDVMLDCWMAWTEDYTLEMARLLEPFRVYWLEECLQPHDYAGFGRLKRTITSTRIVTGEHEYTRYGFQQLLHHDSASIWQPDIHWCGGLTELRRIAALAAANSIPLIPHAGADRDCVHFLAATPNAPWAEVFMPAPGGPTEAYRRFEEDFRLTRGPEGIYTQPSDRPGFGWDWTVTPI